MDETAKTEARNYLTAAGFFVIAAYYLLLAFVRSAGINTTIALISGIGLLLAAVLLVVLRKRDLIAILFMMLAFFFICNGFITMEFAGVIYNHNFAGIVLLTLLITLTGKNKAKWLLIIIPLLMIISIISDAAAGGLVPAFHWILFALSMYFALSCASERLRLPGRNLLTADEDTDFRASGSVLGYLIFAVMSGIYVTHYIAGESVMHLETMLSINIVAAALMILAAVLLFAVGKMRFTPVMFLLMAIADLLTLYSTGAMFIGCGILFIIIGLFAMLRKESRILPGIMLIIYGCSAFFTAYAGGNMPVVSIILNIIPCLIAIYLAFVVYSQKNLPKF